MISKMPIFVYNSIYMGPAIGRIGCSIYGFLGGLTGTSAILSITAISLERFYVITFPLKEKLTRKQSYGVICFIWSYALLFSSIPLLEIHSRYVPEGFLTACSFDYLDKKLESRIFILIFFVAAFVIPLTCIITSYIGIVCVIKKSGFNDPSSDSRRIRVSKQTKSKVNQQNSTSSVATTAAPTANYISSSRPNSRPTSLASNMRPSSTTPSTVTSSASMEMKLTRIAFFLIMAWIISWTPYAVVAMLGVSIGESMS